MEWCQESCCPAVWEDDWELNNNSREKVVCLSLFLSFCFVLDYMRISTCVRNSIFLIELSSIGSNSSYSWSEKASLLYVWSFVYVCEWDDRAEMLKERCLPWQLQYLEGRKRIKQWGA